MYVGKMQGRPEEDRLFIHERKKTTKPVQKTTWDCCLSFLGCFGSIFQPAHSRRPHSDSYRSYHSIKKTPQEIQYRQNARTATDFREVNAQMTTAFYAAQKQLDHRLYGAEWYTQRHLPVPNKKGLIPGYGIKTHYAAAPALSAHSCWATGDRKSMEDYFKVGTVNLGKKRTTDKIIPYYALFDGHEGSTCAEFLTQKIESYLKRHLRGLFELPAPEATLKIYNTLKLYGVCLGRSYRRTMAKKNVGGTFPKSTAIVCLVFNQCVYTGNIGDSRALAVTDQTIVALSEDADPRLPKYCAGVIKRGGRVILSNSGTHYIHRVEHPQSTLCPSMARAIGYKEYGSGINPRAVVTQYRLPQEPLYLIIASDGLWAERSSNEVGTMVRKYLASPKITVPDTASLASHLVEDAYRHGGEDNISVIAAALSKG